MSNNKYIFGEKQYEYSSRRGEEIPVWMSPKYLEARRKAVETLESAEYKGVLDESDFWILMNETKSGKMGYTGLIISHNGCLKINDHLSQDKRFRPECVTVQEIGFTLDQSVSLVYSYCCPDQGIYEVGEVNKSNCKNAYPYAMALKRLMDRVILKNSRLAYSGIYSDSEAEEFAAAMPDESPKPRSKKQTQDAPTFQEAAVRGEEPAPEPEAPKMFREEMIDTVYRIYHGANLTKLLKSFGVDGIDKVTDEQLSGLMERLRKAGKIA